MNKVIIGIVALVAIGIAWFILNPGETFDYVVMVDDEITQLEAELSELDAKVAAGTLTPEEATEAKVRIITRLDAINSAATQSERMQLTAAQRTQLANGLLRLKDALVAYKDTLETVENTAIEAEVKARLSSGHSGSSRHLSLIVADTIEDVEVTVQDSVQDYETDASVDAEIETIVEEVEEEEAMDESESDMSEEEMEIKESEDGNENEEMDDMDPETSEEEMDTEDGEMSNMNSEEEEMEDGDTEASSEAQIEVTR